MENTSFTPPRPLSPSRIVSRTTGRYETATLPNDDAEFSAFVPYALPPAAPSLMLDENAQWWHQRAEQELARLRVAIEMALALGWLRTAFVRREALASSWIEGIRCNLVDLLNYEAATPSASPATPGEADLEEVSNSLSALAYAREQIASQSGLPISMRLLNEAHARLMRGVRGANKGPGEIRRIQNWIGGTRPGNATFVPPPPHLLGGPLTDFEKYLHEPKDDLSPLVRTGLLHVQFETIHPYRDGNGRIGRLLITLLLEHFGMLPEPVLYLSLFFRRHQLEYYRRLGAVRTDGDWEGWTAFYLEGVATIAREAADTARDLLALIAEDRQRVQAAKSGTMAAARLFEQLPQHPVITIAKATGLLETTKPTASKAVTALVDAGVLVEATGQKRDRRFHYNGWLELLRDDTE